MAKEKNLKRNRIGVLVEVFTTNIQSKIQAGRILKKLEKSFPKLKINFDLSKTRLPYPCGHSILRVEGNEINSENIISIMNQSGFMCDILEDKVCR